MTESTIGTTTGKTEQPSFWEDLIDIYMAPAGVFQRQQHNSVWPPMLFVAISIGLIFFVTFNTIEPAFNADIIRGIERQSARGTAVSAEQMQAGANLVMKFTRYGLGAMMLLVMFLLGVVSWGVGKLFGSKQTFHAALVVAAWAYMPRVLGTVLNGVQGLVLDPSKLTSQFALSIGPARFFDVDATNPLLYSLLVRFDLITLWVTVLLAIGLYVTGKVSKGNAVVFGFLIWLIGGLQQLRDGFLAM